MKNNEKFIGMRKINNFIVIFRKKEEDCAKNFHVAGLSEG